MTLALIDGDIVAYRCAASCEKQGVVTEPIEVAVLRADELVRRILNNTSAEEYQLYLTGSNNFRYEVNPEYKANRKDKPRPYYLQDIREYLVTTWNAKVEDGQEADDALGIRQCASEQGTTVICSIDKDLLQIPGKHYNFVTETHLDQSPDNALRFFYYQLIMGDRADNVFGFDGKARQTIPKFLEPMLTELDSYESELDMYSFVLDLYGGDKDRLVMNGRCLWIRRKEHEIWNPPETRGDGQKEDSILS